MTERDEESMGGSDNLTDAERDAVQQMRNSGLPPAEILRRARENVQPANKTAAAAPTEQDVLRRAELVAEGAIGKQQFKEAIRGAVNAFPEFKDEPTDYEQIEATAIRNVMGRTDLPKLSFEQSKQAFADAAKAECERRLKKVGGTKAADQKSTAEERLAKEAAAVDGGNEGGRSAPSKVDDGVPEDFDGSECGLPSKAFAMTDNELSVRTSQRAQKFLRTARGQKV
jgi:hypothetical protein